MGDGDAPGNTWARWGLGDRLILCEDGEVSGLLRHLGVWGCSGTGKSSSRRSNTGEKMPGGSCPEVWNNLNEFLLTQCQTLQRVVQSSYSSTWWQLRMLPCKEFEYWQYEMFRTNIPILIHPRLSSCYAAINNIGNSPLSWWDLTLEPREDFRLLLMSVVFTFLSLRFVFRCCTDVRLCDEGKKME